jgi:hypothetical protein
MMEERRRVAEERPDVREVREERGRMQSRVSRDIASERDSVGKIDGSTLDAIRPGLIGLLNWILLALSFLGTVVAFHRGNWAVWKFWSEGNNLISGVTFFALGLQVWCTGFQWFNRMNRKSIWYIQAYLLDMPFTTIGLTPIFLAIFQMIVVQALGMTPPIIIPVVPYLSDGTPMTIVALIVAGIFGHFISQSERRLVKG